jgi:hypothetical protein
MRTLKFIRTFLSFSLNNRIFSEFQNKNSRQLSLTVRVPNEANVQSTFLYQVLINTLELTRIHRYSYGIRIRRKRHFSIRCRPRLLVVPRSQLRQSTFNSFHQMAAYTVAMGTADFHSTVRNRLVVRDLAVRQVNDGHCAGVDKLVLNKEPAVNACFQQYLKFRSQ